MRDARYRIMGANVKTADGADVPWVPDDTLVRRGALTVGLIGISTVETPRVTKASNVEGLRFVDPVPEVEARARALRARGADVVILLAHEGGFCNNRPADGAAPGCNGPILEVTRRLGPAVNAVVSGHSHSAISTLVGAVPVVQARSSGRTIGVVDLQVGASQVSAAAAPELRDVGTDTLGTHAGVDSIVQRALASVGPRVNRVIGTVREDLRRSGSQYPLGNMIADAMRSAGTADVAVMNNGGIRADLRAGEVTFGTLYEVQPFGNVLYRATVRGAALRTYMERLVRRDQPNAHVSGVRVTYDTAAAEGSRIRELLVAGRPVRDDATYTIVLSDFLLTGGDGLGIQQEAVRVEPLNLADIDALVTWVQAQPGRVVAAPAERRLVPVAAPAR
jgi:5'-nucleotidase